MSRVFLNTSAYSAFQAGHRKIHYRLKESEAILVSPIVLGELQSGFLKGRRAERNRDLLQQFLQTPRVEVISIGEEIADRYARILEYLRNAGTPIPTNDIWIAAGVMATGAPLLTLDWHFRKVPQIVAHLYEVEPG